MLIGATKSQRKKIMKINCLNNKNTSLEDCHQQQKLVAYFTGIENYDIIKLLDIFITKNKRIEKKLSSILERAIDLRSQFPEKIY